MISLVKNTAVRCGIFSFLVQSARFCSVELPEKPCYTALRQKRAAAARIKRPLMGSIYERRCAATPECCAALALAARREEV